MKHKVDTYSEFVPREIALQLKESGMGNTFGGMLSIPSYYETFEWFCSERGIVITLEPFFTYTLKGNIAYTWKISYPNFQTSKMDEVREEDMNNSLYGGSFRLTADDAIKFALTLGDKRSQDIEVNAEDL